MRLYRILYSRLRFWAGPEELSVAGFASCKSDICPISLNEPAPKDVSVAPASFGAGLSEIGQIAELRPTKPRADCAISPQVRFACLFLNPTHRYAYLFPRCWLFVTGARAEAPRQGRTRHRTSGGVFMGAFTKTRDGRDGRRHGVRKPYGTLPSGPFVQP